MSDCGCCCGENKEKESCPKCAEKEGLCPKCNKCQSCCECK